MNLIIKEIQKEVNKTTPEQLQRINQAIDLYIDTIGRRDYAAMAELLPQLGISPGGIVEQITARLMGLGFEPPSQIQEPAELERVDNATPRD